MEEWRPIIDYPEYEVSNLGQVRRNGRILKPLKNSKDYYQIALHKNGQGKKYYIHRLVAEAFIPNIDNKQEVDHIDRNLTNNLVSNLRWVTRNENQMNTKACNRLLYGMMKYKTGFKIRFRRNQKLIYFGYRSTLEEAIQLRDETLIQLGQ